MPGTSSSRARSDRICRKLRIVGVASGSKRSSAALFCDVGTDGLMNTVRALGMRRMRATSLSVFSHVS